VNSWAGFGPNSYLGTTTFSPSIGLKKFFNSYTTYQFPNPFDQQQDPLSRLEFPIDQWFIGGELKACSRFLSIRGEIWTNINRESGLKMQDSDWDDGDAPTQKTIFSESKCRLNRGIFLDTGVDFQNPLVSLRSISPTIGFRYQFLSFTTYDGFQTGIGEPVSDLPGDGIDFKQYYYHGYLGLIFRHQIAQDRVVPGILTCEVKMDYALVSGYNEDKHLLRAGDRLTVDRTSGYCWHLGATLSSFNWSRLNTKLECDFKRIVTKGSHELTNPVLGIDFSFDGAKVYSDQLSVSASGEWTF
jgi:outer membrane protease